MRDLAFSHSVTIRAPRSRVWTALVDPSQVARYHLAPLSTIELIEGGRIVYGTEEQHMIAGRITAFETGSFLEHTFKFVSHHLGTQHDPETLVRYIIEDESAAVRLTVAHSGFAGENQTYANISGGWPFLLEKLKTVVETNFSSQH